MKKLLILFGVVALAFILGIGYYCDFNYGDINFTKLYFDLVYKPYKEPEFPVELTKADNSTSKLIDYCSTFDGVKYSISVKDGEKVIVEVETKNPDGSSSKSEKTYETNSFDEIKVGENPDAEYTLRVKNISNGQTNTLSETPFELIKIDY